MNLGTRRLVTAAGMLASFVVPVGAQVEWPPASAFAPRLDEQAAILRAAADAGLSDPVSATLMPPQFGCRGVLLESERLYAGSRRSWRRVYLADDTSIDDCLAHRFRWSAWRASGRLQDATEWLVDGGQVHVWITLTDFLTGDSRYHAISYEDARPVVLAFVDSLVIDRRKPSHEFPTDPALPIGRRAVQITEVGGRDRGWEVVANGWTFEVESTAGRLVVTASWLPIP